MVTILEVGRETIYIDDVEFINHRDEGISITTRDAKVTEVPTMAEEPTITVFTDNGILIKSTGE